MIAHLLAPAGRQAEIELLLRCARARVDEAGAEAIAALCQRDLDWPYVVQLGQRHRVGSLLFWHLSAICPVAIPPPAMAFMRRQFYAVAGHSQRQTNELLSILRLLSDHRIAAIPWKGPALTAAIYQHPAMRVSSDLDILVRPRDVARASQLLVSRGLRRVFAGGAAWEAISRPFRHARTFVGRAGGLAVDLHWKLSQSYFPCRLAGERLWDRQAIVKIDGQLIRTLPPDLTLIALCMHGARHGWSHLAWICDVAELIGSCSPLLWDSVVRLADDLRGRRMLLLALCLAQQLLGARLPGDVASFVAGDRSVPALARQVYRDLFGEAGSGAELAQALFYLHVREHWRDRVQYGPELLRIGATLVARRSATAP